MNLSRLIYSSYASTSLTYNDLKDIMKKSEKNNKQDGITGFLCYGDSMFLQVLEGDRKIVSKTYHRIAMDDRHHTPVLIECVPIEQRLFGIWSMKTVKLGDMDAETSRNLILKYSGTTVFEPDLMTPQQCLNLIKELATLYNLIATV